MTPIDKAKANPKSKAAAIRAKCWDCQGGDADPGWIARVRSCTCEDSCPLWHVRPYRSVARPRRGVSGANGAGAVPRGGSGRFRPKNR